MHAYEENRGTEEGGVSVESNKCTCTYTCTHIHTHTHTHAHTYIRIHIHIHTHTYAYTYRIRGTEEGGVSVESNKCACTYTCTHIHTHTHTHAHTYIRIHIHMHTHTYAYTYRIRGTEEGGVSVESNTCTCTYTYTHIHTHTHTHAHTYIRIHIHMHTHTYAYTYRIRGTEEGGVSVESTLVISLRKDDRIAPYETHPGLQLHTFTPIHSRLDTFVGSLMQLFAAARLPPDEAEASTQQIVDDKEACFVFDLLWLEDGLHERVLFDTRAELISPLVPTKGRLIVTNTRVYFQPFCNIAHKPVFKVKRTSVGRVYPRRHLFRQTAIEMFLTSEHNAMQPLAAVALSAGDVYSSKNSLFFVFSSTKDRDALLSILRTAEQETTANAPELFEPPSPQRHREAREAGFHVVSREECAEHAVASTEDESASERRRWRDAEVQTLTAQWQRKELSNFEYLMWLNVLADRSFNDLTQYPVMPWVISDYTSLTLDLTNPHTYRDLTKPVGALDQARLEAYRLRFREMPDPKFYYGTHYSTPGYVLHYLVRDAPELMLHLQRGKFDAPDRTFWSVTSSYR
jgi:hypothetical protein